MNINRHFKRESKILIGLFLAIPFMGLLAALIVPKILHTRQTIKVEKCLDNGGSFNYQNCECDFKENHAYTEKHICR